MCDVSRSRSANIRICNAFRLPIATRHITSIRSDADEPDTVLLVSPVDCWQRHDPPYYRRSRVLRTGHPPTSDFMANLLILL